MTPRRALTPGRHTVRVPAGGLDRVAVVHVPGRVASQVAAGDAAPPLVLALHGTGSGPTELLRMSALDAAAHRHGFVVAAAQGATPAGPGYAWDRPAPRGPDPDVDFLLALVDRLTDAGYADPGRVYATGLSGGGRLACRLAAARGDRIAAVAPVGGLRAGDPSDDPRSPDPATFPAGRPVPLVAFHGTADPVNPYDGGGPDYWRYPVVAALEAWASRNGCAGPPRVARVGPHVRRISYDVGPRGAPTVLYVVEGGGHTWPASAHAFPAALGPVSDEVDATETLWEFFTRHARRPESA